MVYLVSLSPWLCVIGRWSPIIVIRDNDMVYLLALGPHASKF